MTIDKPESIKILNVKLENWAQYRDINIPFNFDSEEAPIIFFVGENGAGKTRLFEAVKCALFGPLESRILEKDGTKSDQIDLYDLYPSDLKQQLINDYNDKKSDLTANMRLVMNLENTPSSGLSRLYKIDRIWKFSNFMKNKDNSIIPSKVTPFIEIKVRDHGGFTWSEEDVRIFSKRLENWFPEPVRDFYFFDGEKLSKTMENPQTAKIQDRSLMKTDWYPIDREIYPELDDLSNKYSKQASKRTHKNKLVKESENRLSNLRKKLNTYGKTFRDLEAQITESRTRISILEQNFMKKYGEFRKSDIVKETEKHEKIQKIMKLEGKGESYYKKIGTIMGDHRNRRYNFEMLLIEEIIDDVVQDLRKKKEDNIIPVKIDKGVFEYLITKDEFLCGNCIKSLKKEQEKVINEDLNQAAKEFLNDLSKFKDEFVELKENLRKESDEYVIVVRGLEALGNKPKNPTEAKTIEEFLEFKEKVDNLEKTIDRAQVELEKTKGKIENTDKDRSKAETSLIRNKSSAGKIEDSDLCEFVSQQVRDTFANIKDSLNCNLLTYIKRRTSKTFLGLIPDSHLFDEVLITDEWKFGYTHKNNPDVPIYDASKGQFHVIGLSFLHSLSGIANCNLPIFFDTPFGRLGRRPKINIGSKIANLFEGTQIVLFLTEEEANNMLQYIKGKKGHVIINPSGNDARIEDCDEESLKDIIQTWKDREEKKDEQRIKA